MKDPSPREQSLVECAFIATARSIPRCSSVGEAFATTRSRSGRSNIAEELATESRTDHLESVDPGAYELGTEGAEEGPAASPQGPDSQDSEEDPEDVRRERLRRICSHQAHDPGLAPLVSFLRNETEQLSLRQTTHLAKVADQFVLDFRDALFYSPKTSKKIFYTIVTQTSKALTRDTERYVKECVDCVTAKGLPRNPGSSPGNLLATRPFQVVSMDFVIPLPQAIRGNTALLLFQCAFSRFVMCKAMVNTEAQDVAEAYEECAFRRFGASKMIRHDRDPRFMGRANGQQERSVQTVIRSVKAYVQTGDQSDWDELAEKLMWALNTSFAFARLDTPFYLVHDWDAQGTIQRQVEYARAWARDLQAKAKSRRAEDHNRKWKQLTDRLKEGFEVGDSVWLYLARVCPGLTKKLAHLWHGPFRILEKGSDYRYRLQVEGTEYRFYPWVHVSRLKPRTKYPERPSEAMNIPEEDDFDAALLREDSWEPDEGSGEYKVEAILDVRWVTRTRTSRRVKEYQVKWKGYEVPDWVPQRHLNCGRRLYEFDQGERARVRFQAMQSGDELPGEEVR
ncbi:reverse transcriptase [Phytophthora megakarya]|uniref:Reverse transcriptase n=1 Tax=Phytophthora megakarya TaxID=4795 RepID=A0A225VM42_9STRA|nr:reverse transcriptase [Phytophthora megakarya]